MPSGGAFIAGYNGQIAVDAACQIIVAQPLSANPADFAPSSRWSTRSKPISAARRARFQPTRVPVPKLTSPPWRHVGSPLSLARPHPPRRDKSCAGRVLKHKPLMQAMADKIRSAGRRSRYRLRKRVVELVFGQIKQATGFLAVPPPRVPQRSSRMVHAPHSPQSPQAPPRRSMSESPYPPQANTKPRSPSAPSILG